MSETMKRALLIIAVVILLPAVVISYAFPKKSLDDEAPFNVHKRLLQNAYVCNFEKELADAFANDDMISGHEAIALSELCKKNVQ